MVEIDKAKLGAIRAICDLIESCEDDIQSAVIAHRMLYDLSGKTLSEFAQRVLKSGGVLPPKDAKLPISKT